VEQGPRYAVFFIPSEQSDLYRFGSAVLGYDCYTGASVDQPFELRHDPVGWRRATEEPRRYGFHATLKAPFRLSPSCTEQQLVAAVHSFVGLGYALPAITPAVRMLGDFAAVVAAESEPSLASLAASCTTIFDAYRAPMSPQERARRIAMGLSQSQIQNLDRWGYPFVLSEFQFHMTLTGKIQDGRREDTLAVLQACFRRMHGDRQVLVDRIALAKQESSLDSFKILTHATPGVER